MTVTFSFDLLKSGGSVDGLVEVAGETESLEGGWKDAFEEGVVGLSPVDLADIGVFFDRNGEMLVDDLWDLETEPASDIFSEKKLKEWRRETNSYTGGEEEESGGTGSAHMPARATSGLCSDPPLRVFISNLLVLLWIVRMLFVYFVLLKCQTLPSPTCCLFIVGQHNNRVWITSTYWFRIGLPNNVCIEDRVENDQ